MRPPPAGKSQIGALAGVIVGATGGLFAVGLPHAILERNPVYLLNTPMLSLMGWIVSGFSAWFLGDMAGRIMRKLFKSPKAEAVGGAIAGLIPIALIAWWGWYMVTRHR